MPNSMARELTPEEGKALSKDIQEVLEKHNVDMFPSINLIKREEPAPQPMPSPEEFTNGGDTQTT